MTRGQRSSSTKAGGRRRDSAVPVSRTWRASWERLSAEIRACRRCPLGALRTHAVVYRGGLRPRIVFVGEAPGVEEDRQGVPFVGRSGARLDAAIRELALSSESFGVLNVLKCRPPANRFDRVAARTCRPYLDRQLALLHPDVVVTLGNHALQTLEPGAPGVLTAAGHARVGAGTPVFPMIHPAAAMRSRRWAERWLHDVEALRHWWRARTPETL
jgi:uracil-DNA glycosylase